MDSDTVDQSYAQLEQEAQVTTQAIQTLAGKLQAASNAGDQNAREWLLDLKEITLDVQQEQNQTSTLLQNIHSMVDNHVQSAPAAQPQHNAGGPSTLTRFLGGGMGRAIMNGAGFGIGNDLVNRIF